jgi:hypothetical protein
VIPEMPIIQVRESGEIRCHSGEYLNEPESGERLRWVQVGIRWPPAFHLIQVWHSGEFRWESGDTCLAPESGNIQVTPEST